MDLIEDISGLDWFDWIGLSGLDCSEPWAYLLLALNLAPNLNSKKGNGIIAIAMNPKVLRAHGGVRPMNTVIERQTSAQQLLTRKWIYGVIRLWLLTLNSYERKPSGKGDAGAGNGGECGEGSAGRVCVEEV